MMAVREPFEQPGPTVHAPPSAQVTEAVVSSHPANEASPAWPSPSIISARTGTASMRRTTPGRARSSSARSDGRSNRRSNFEPATVADPDAV